MCADVSAAESMPFYAMMTDLSTKMSLHVGSMSSTRFKRHVFITSFLRGFFCETLHSIHEDTFHTLGR